MKIEFSPEQFEKLLKLVYLGNYMVNGVRAPEDQVKEYEEMERYIFSFAPEMGLSHLVSLEAGKYFPSYALETDDEINEHIGLYDEVTFMDELEVRLDASEDDEEGGCCDHDDSDCCDDEEALNEIAD